jgi:hemerythrin-like metal-binding protein
MNDGNTSGTGASDLKTLFRYSSNSSFFAGLEVCSEAGRFTRFNPFAGLVNPGRRAIVKDLVWGEILSVGVKEIDEDHRKLIHIFNILNHSVMERESPEYLAAVLEELINCTVWHFSHEERLMLKYRYKEIEEHKAQHRELIQSAKELQQEILQAEKPMVDEQIVFLERWLTEHILTADGRLGSYLSQVI